MKPYKKTRKRFSIESIPPELMMDGRMAISSDGHPIIYEFDSKMCVLASRLKGGKRKLTKSSDDSDDDSAGMEYIQDMLDSF